MSRRYAAGGKRLSSQTHARRAWVCPGARTVYGNGGRSSHRRACRTWAAQQLEAVERALADMAAGTWGGRLSPVRVERFRHGYELERDRLRERLGLPPAAG